MLFPKGSNLSLIKTLDSAAALQENKRTEEQAEAHKENAVSEIQTEGDETGQTVSQIFLVV